MRMFAGPNGSGKSTLKSYPFFEDDEDSLLPYPI